MYMKEVIIDVLNNLAKRRPLFWSEADFQFEFAWELHKKLGEEAKIYLERRFEIDMDSSDTANEKSNQSTTNKSLNKLYVDIWVEYDNKTYPIELKYTTKRCKIYDSENPVETKEQSARDAGCYRFLWDIKRLEEIKTSLSPKEVKGYAIMLTSDAGYYEERKPKQPTLFDDFRLTHNRKIKKDTELKWNLSRIAEDKRADHWSRNWPKFTLKGEYILQWQYFKPIQTKQVIDDKDNIVTLKYLLVEV
mgnify:FL=1